MATATENKVFHVALVTPEALMLEADVYQVVFPAHDGMIGILTHRAPLLTKMGVGVMRLDMADGEAKKFVVAGGFAQMKGDTLTILTDEALAEAAVTRELIKAEAGKIKAAGVLSGPAYEQRQKALARVAAMEQLLG